MKKLFFVLMLVISVIDIHAQKDTSIPKKIDTIRVGNIVIVTNDSLKLPYEKKKYEAPKISIHTSNKDNLVTIDSDTVQIGRLQITKTQEDKDKKDWQTMIENGDFNNTKISIKRMPKKLKDITTNWWIFDLGFTNYIDKTSPIYYMTNPIYYDPTIVSNYDMTLNNKKSSNVNIWVVQQKVNVYKHIVNVKYGIGFEMFNFRLNEAVSFREHYTNYFKKESIEFSKNKLFVKYLTIPFQFNFQPHPEKKKSFYASLGVSAGYLIKARNKQISEERGKQKFTGNFNLNDWRFATIGELGIGSLRLYGSYGMNNLYDKNKTYFDFQTYALGIRFSKF